MFSVQSVGSYYGGMLHIISIYTIHRKVYRKYFLVLSISNLIVFFCLMVAFAGLIFHSLHTLYFFRFKATI